MKTKIFALFLAVAGLFMFSSCEKEVSTLYTFKVDTLNVVEDGGAAYKTHEYLTSPRYLDWEESEYIDNDAMTSDKAAQQNDDEAIREFLPLQSFFLVHVLRAARCPVGNRLFHLHFDTRGWSSLAFGKSGCIISDEIANGKPPALF